MQPDPEKSKLRAIQYFYIDGSFEFGFGGLCLLLAGFFFLQDSIRDGLVKGLLTFLFFVIFFGGSMLINRIIRRFKEQVTYPRTGYVSYQQPQKVRKGLRIGLMLILAVIVGAGFTTMVTRSPELIYWMPAVTSCVIGFVLTWLGFRSALPRFYGLGFLILITGVILSLLGQGDLPGLVMIYGLSGLILFLSGGLTLNAFIRHHPSTNEVEDEL